MDQTFGPNCIYVNIIYLALISGFWKSWKTWKITKKSSMHGKVMEFEKKLKNHGKIMEFYEIV